MNNDKIDMINLIKEKELYESKLNLLVFGAIEVRTTNNAKSIYVHKRERGLARTIYVGTFSDELYNQLLINNIEVKTIKKRLKQVEKSLKEQNYSVKEMTKEVELNIDFAKRNLVDTIYKQAVLEGVAVTFLDTETIIEGGKISNISIDDIQKVNNLKHAWQLILDKDVILSPSDFNLLTLINKLVEEGFYYSAGKIRTVPVAIGGTKWKPELPIETLIKEEFDDIINSDIDICEKAIKTLLFITKRQIFIDGNKRTAVIFANHLLISNGAGLIAVPEDEVSEYKKLLIEYYETDNEDKIFKFLKNKCLTRIN